MLAMLREACYVVERMGFMLKHRVPAVSLFF
jgi:hypothetical protein